MAVQNELVVAGVGDDAARLAQNITTSARAGRPACSEFLEGTDV